MPIFHTKHYQLIAHTISNLNLSASQKMLIMADFINMFKKDNNIFDAEKFWVSIFSTIENSPERR